MSILLLIAIFLPSAAALIVGRDPSRAKRAAMFAAILTLAAAVLPACRIAANDSCINTRLELGLDGSTVWPFLMTCLAMLAAVAIGPNCPLKNGAAYYRLLLVLQTGLLGLFAARESLLFFVFYEFSLIPFFFMIAGDSVGSAGGSAGGRRAATRFLCVEAGGGQMVLLGLLAGMATGGMATGGTACQWIFFLLAAGFAVRVVVPLLVCLAAIPRSFSDAAALCIPAGLMTLSGVYGVLLFIVKKLPCGN